MGRSFVERLFLWVDDMSRSLGVLTLDLIARTGGFEQGMDRASRRVRATAQDMEAAKRVADRYIMAIGAAGVAFASAAAAMAVSAAKSMDATAKMAQQIGTTTEALTGMRFAVQQFANVSDQALDNSLRRMTRRIASAAEGAGAAKGALDALGLSAQELARMSPDRQFMVLADAIKGTEDQATRLRYAFDLFGREGQSLVTALQQGSRALKESADTARIFGVVLSTEAGAAAEDLMTNLGNLSKASEGFRQQVVERLLPSMVEITDQMVEFSKSTGDMADKVAVAMKATGVAAVSLATIITGRLVGAALTSAAAWTKATLEAARHQAQLASLAAAVAGTSRSVAAGASMVAGATTALGTAGRVALGVLGGPAGLLVTTGLAATAFLSFGRSATDAASDIDLLTGSLEGLTTAQVQLMVFDQEDVVKGLRDEVEEYKRSIEIAQRSFQGIIDMHQDASVEAETFSRELLKEQAELDAVQAKLREAEDRLQELNEKLRDLSGDSRDAADGVRDLSGALTETSDAAKTYLERLEDRSVTAGLKTQHEQLMALVDAGKLVFSPEDMERAKGFAKTIDDSSRSFNRAGGGAKSLKSEMDRLLGSLLPQKKAAEDYSKNMAFLDKALETGKVSVADYDKALKELSKQYKEQTERLLPDNVKKVRESAKAAEDQAKALAKQVQTFGLSESAVLRLSVAETDAAIARLEGVKATEISAGASQDRINAIELEIEALQRLREWQLKSVGEQETLEFLTKQKTTWENWARDVEQIFNRVGQSLTDAIFEGGRSAKQLLKDIFKGLTFNVLINPIMGAMQGWMTNALGPMMGFVNPAGEAAGSLSSAMGLGNIATTLKSAWSALSGGLTQTFADLGAKLFMSSSGGPLSQAGTALMESAGMLGTAASYLGGIGAGMGLGTLISGQYSVFGDGKNQWMAPAVGTAGGALIGSQIGMIGGPLGAAIGGIIGGAVNRLFGRGPKEYSHSYLDLGLAGAQTQAVLEQDWRQKGGVFRSGKEGTDYTGLGPGDDLFDAVDSALAPATAMITEYAKMLYSEDSLADISSFRYRGKVQLDHGDEEDVKRRIEEQINAALHQFTDTLTGGLRYLEDETDARMDIINDLWNRGEDVYQEMVEAGFKDLVSYAESLIQTAKEAQGEVIQSPLVEFQREGELLHNTIERLAVSLLSLNPLLEAINVNAFEVNAEMGNMASNLIDLLGGMESAQESFDFYYQTFFSEAERMARQTEELTKVFEAFDLALPKTHEHFRELVESIDLTDDAGQVLFATMMNIAPAFDQVATYAQSSAGVMVDSFQRVEMLANRMANTLQAIQAGGALADRIGREMGLSAVFSQRRESDLWSIIGDATPEQQIELAGELTDLVMNRIQVEQEAQRKQTEALREQLSSVTRIRDLARSLQDYLRSLESSSLAPYSLSEKITIAEGDLSDLVAKARGGDAQAMGQVQSALQNALQLWRDYGASGAEYQAAYERLTGMAGNLATGSYSAAELQVQSLEHQIEQLDSITGYSSRQLAELSQIYDIATAATEALEEQYAQDAEAMAAEIHELERIGLDTARLHDIAELMQAMPAQIGALINGSLSEAGQQAIKNTEAGLLQSSSDEPHAEDSIVREWPSGSSSFPDYMAYMRDYPDALAAFHEDSQGKTLEEFAKWHYEKFGKFEGRSYRIGTASVPSDMLAQVHKGEIIIDPQSSDVLRKYGIQIHGSGSQETVTELRALRAEVAELRTQNERLSQHLADVTVESSKSNAETITRGMDDSISRRGREDAAAGKSIRKSLLT